MTHVLCKGVANSYFTHGGITRGHEIHTAYQLPVSPPVPIDVQYLETVSPQVPVSRVGFVVLVWRQMGFGLREGEGHKDWLVQFACLSCVMSSHP